MYEYDPPTHSGKAVFQRSATGEAREKRPPLAEIRGGERIKAIATKGHRSTRKETLGGIPFCGFSCPFVAIPHCPSFAQCSMFSSRESPRSGVNVVGLRPSLIAQHSLRGFFSSIHAQGEGGFSVINDGRSPEKTPSLRGGENPSHEKHKSARKSILALPIFVATPTRRRRPGHSSFLAFLASLAWDDFTQRAQSPRRGVGLGAALFVAFRGNSLLPVTAGGCRMTP